MSLHKGGKDIDKLLVGDLPPATLRSYLNEITVFAPRLGRPTTIALKRSEYDALRERHVPELIQNLPQSIPPEDCLHSFHVFDGWRSNVRIDLLRGLWHGQC